MSSKLTKYCQKRLALETRRSRESQITNMMQVSNPRATIGKYRHLAHGAWTTILNQTKHGVGLAKINASTKNRPVTFTRAEVAFLLEKYVRAA
jgi:hypothetical protein